MLHMCRGGAPGVLTGFVSLQCKIAVDCKSNGMVVTGDFVRRTGPSWLYNIKNTVLLVKSRSALKGIAQCMVYYRVYNQAEVVRHRM